MFAPIVAVAWGLAACFAPQVPEDRLPRLLHAVVQGDDEQARRALIEIGGIGTHAAAASDLLLTRLELAQGDLRQEILATLGLIGSPTPQLQHVLWQEEATSLTARASLRSVLARQPAAEERIGEVLGLWETLLAPPPADHLAVEVEHRERVRHVTEQVESLRLSRPGSTLFEREASLVPELCRWLEADGAWEKGRRSTQLALSMLRELGATAAPAVPVLLRRVQQVNRLPDVVDLDISFLPCLTKLAPYAPEHHAAVRAALAVLQARGDWLGPHSRTVVAFAPLRDLTIATPTEALIAALADSSIAVRLLAVELLTRRGRGAQQAAPALAATILDMPPEVRPLTSAAFDWVGLQQRVPEAIARIDPDHPMAESGFRVGVKSWSIPDRAAIVRALGAVRADAVWPAELLVERLREERSVTVVRAALRALAERAQWSPEAQDEVERYSAHPLPEIASLAAKAVAGR